MPFSPTAARRRSCPMPTPTTTPAALRWRPPPSRRRRRQAQRPWDLGAVCEELIDHCLRLGSRDNMSVVIVLFQKGLLKPQPA